MRTGRRPRRDAIERQHRIRMLHSLGLRPGEIADRLGGSRWTVSNHLREVRAEKEVVKILAGASR